MGEEFLHFEYYSQADLRRQRCLNYEMMVVTFSYMNQNMVVELVLFKSETGDVFIAYRFM